MKITSQNLSEGVCLETSRTDVVDAETMVLKITKVKHVRDAQSARMDSR
jgi:hypothetical protein